jgi:hypothetical protein
MPVKPITPCPPQGVIRGASELKDYFDAFVKPNLPDASAVRKLHGLLREYFDSQPRIFVIRDGAKGSLRPADGLSYYGSDNEAALWFWVSCQPGFEQRLQSLRELIREQAFPIGDPNSRNECLALGATWRTWGKGDAAWPIRGTGGWKHCHVFDAGARHLDHTRPGLMARMARLIHPLNHFLFPKPYRRDYGGHKFALEGLTKADPGEDPIVQAFARGYIADHYGRELFAEFTELVSAGAAEAVAPIREFSIAYTYVAGSSEPKKGTTGMSLAELFQWLSAWYDATEGQSEETRLDGKAKSSTGGVSKARLLEITESTNTKWNYNTTFKVAGDTQRGAIGVFLALYEASNGDYAKIFVEPGRSKDGKGKTLKLALQRHVTGWQVLSVRDWQDLELSA